MRAQSVLAVLDQLNQFDELIRQQQDMMSQLQKGLAALKLKPLLLKRLNAQVDYAQQNLAELDYD